GGSRRRVGVEPAITRVLLWGVLAARLGFVALFWEEYLREPVTILDIRDGGFLPEAGLVVAAIVGLYHGWRASSLRRPLAISVAAGTLTWIFCTGAVALMETKRSEEHTSELQSRENLVCRLLLEKKKQFHEENRIYGR